MSKVFNENIRPYWTLLPIIEQSNISAEDIEIFEMCLKFDEKERGRYFNSLFPLIIEKGHMDLAKLWVDAGLDLNGKDERGFTALQESFYDRDYDLARYLIEKNANVTASDGLGFTPLAHAAGRGNMNLVQLLLEKGALNNPLEGGRSPLVLAYHKNYDEILELLLEFDADINFADSQFGSLLDQALEKKDFPFIKRLIDLGVNLNQRGYNYEPPIAMAYSYKFSENNDEILELFLANGVDLNTTKTYSPMLHQTVRKNDFATTQRFIECGAEVNIRHRRLGHTPIHVACKENNIEMIKLLIDNGADITIPNKKGTQPLSLLNEDNRADIHNYLEERNQSMNKACDESIFSINGISLFASEAKISDDTHSITQNNLN